MEAVGYDMYMKLLNEAILEEKGETVKKKVECAVEMNVSAYIPDSYIKSPVQRIDAYKKISLIETKEDRMDVVDELLDRYGELPRAAKNLLLIALIRGNAIACGVEEVADEGQTVNIYPSHIDIDVWMRLSDEFDWALKIVMSSRTHISLSLKKTPKPLEYINKIFEKYLAFSKEENEG